jgi:hypothetical protein
MTPLDQSPARYRIRIRGHLDPAWSSWFEGLTVTQKDDDTTELVGTLVDQAALYGLLARLRDLGAILLAVERLAADGPAATPVATAERQPDGGTQTGRTGGATEAGVSEQGASPDRRRATAPEKPRRRGGGHTTKYASKPADRKARTDRWRSCATSASRP